MSTSHHPEIFATTMQRRSSLRWAPQVLVVEDDEYQALLLTRWLAEAGIGAVIASSTQEAIPLLNNDALLAVVSNYELPDGCGLDLVRIARERHPWRRTLILTSLDSFAVAVAALKQGANDFIAKPIQRNRLIDSVATLLKEASDQWHRARKHILAIGAHPDDIVVGIGATLARHIAAGDHVSMLTFTNGAREGDSVILKQESESSANTLGASLFWGGFCDGAIHEGADSIQLIESHVERMQPDTVYVHSAYDTHPDHRAVHGAALVACQAVDNILCYQSSSTTALFSPTRFVDVALFVEEKLNMINAYQSYLPNQAYLDHDFIRATARYWGRFAAYREVEPLEVIRTTD